MKKRVFGMLSAAVGAVGMLVVSVATADAQSIAGAHRPASVPAGYLVTPFGYFHASCVVKLLAGDALRPGEKAIRHADGTTSAMHHCAYPHYKADGASVVGDAPASTTPDISHAYVEYATVTTSASYGYLDGEWTVPPAPAANDGQTLYLFPGLEDIDNVVTILQPVLGWNSDYNAAWGIASWNCCVTGTAYEAKPAKVAAGDTILGYMYNSCPPGTLSCGSWDVVTTDLRNGNKSELIDTSNFGQVFNWAFGAAFEVYGITQCADYPTVDGSAGSSAISFHELNLYDNNLKQVDNPAWQTVIAGGLTPRCNYGTSLPQDITLSY